MFSAFSIILSLSALYSYVNHKVLKLPQTIGLMILALFTVAGIFVVGQFSGRLHSAFHQLIIDIDFETVLLDIMLSFLLFAGAMHVNVRELRKEALPIVIFATIGVLLSTAVIGGLVYWIAGTVGVAIPLLHCLLFGALISPTDPIAVLAILKEARISSSLELKIEGESLFNDGIGVVVFVAIYSIATTMGEAPFGVLEIGELFLREAIGGLAYGLLQGVVAGYLMRTVADDPKLCVLITLAVVTGGYSGASLLQVSGPLAMVVAGLYIGNRINTPAFAAETERFLETFWEMLDDVLNGVLFVLIGLVTLTLEFRSDHVLLGLLAIPIVLLARIVSVGIPYALLQHAEHRPWKTVAVLSWGGLRGGISVALALSLGTAVSSREAIAFMTCAVVIFSILVQGLSIGPLVKKLMLSQGEDRSESPSELTHK